MRVIGAIGAWFRRRTPSQVLVAALAVFLIYSWPGFVGWDTRSHLLEERAMHISDAHPPAVAWLVRIVEIFVRGPAGVLLVQAVSLLAGLYMLFSTKMSRRAAAWCTAGVFLFPPIAGVQALIAKDCLMAGFLMIGIACLADDQRPRRRWWALVWIFLGTLMRWNALSATFVPILLLFRWRPSTTGVKRYAIATGVWLAVTGMALKTDDLLADEHAHLWYWSNGYEDIAGTLEYIEPLDDAQMLAVLDGVPLVQRDHLHERFKALYSPSYYFQLMRNEGRIFNRPANDEERAAIARAWKRLVFGHPGAYLRYRIDNFRLLLQLDRPESFSNVYVWFTVIGAPETIPELDHDAGPSRLQQIMIPASMKISLTPVYYVFIYFALCFLLVPFAWRNALAMSTLLSAIGYELALFFLAATTDYRYSQWMILCSVVSLILVVARRLAAARRR